MIYLKYCTIDNDCTYSLTYLHAFQVDFWLFASMDANPESVEKREKRLRSRRERERARCASKTAEQREERLRMRDRARRASQATEDREARLQQRRYRLDAETAE